MVLDLYKVTGILIEEGYLIFNKGATLLGNGLALIVENRIISK